MQPIDISLVITNLYLIAMDLLQSQIKKSCSLALPEGLKDLMSDISREVLRAQPNNVPQFIADYLEVLLEVREKLSFACHVCTDTCKIICEPELYNELKEIGLSDEDIDIAIQIVEEHWDQPNVKEQSLLIKLAEKISMDDMQIPLIRDAIQRAIKLHHLKDGVLSGSKHKDNEVTDSLNHTLDWYRQNKTTTEEVFMASNFDPCLSAVSSTDTASTKPVYRALSAHEASESEREYVSFDYSLHSTSGKVKFVDEKIISKSDHSDKETKTFEGNNTYADDKNTRCQDDDDHITSYMAETDDKNVINDETELTDNDIEENIKSDYQDDTASSVDEDFM